MFVMADGFVRGAGGLPGVVCLKADVVGEHALEIMVRDVGRGRRGGGRAGRKLAGSQSGQGVRRGGRRRGSLGLGGWRKGRSGEQHGQKSGELATIHGASHSWVMVRNAHGGAQMGWLICG